jgi:hypothetical protein
MNTLILSIRKRFLLPVVSLLGFLIWTGLCRSHYESYWNGTIHRVQTVDFNILHHTLPPTLSYLILSGQPQEVQKVLDCTYGIFGLVITDPAGTEILFRTQAVYKKKSWQHGLTMESLAEQGEPFDYLTDPPPTAVHFTHQSPRVDKISVHAPTSHGRVIGRVYYCRGVPPRYEEDLVEAVCSNWLELTGSKRGYILLTIIVLATSFLIVSLVLWRQRILGAREQELLARENELTIKRKALQHLNADLGAQRQKKEWLEQEAEIAYQRALRLKDSLLRIKQTILSENNPVKSGQSINVRPPHSTASQLISEVETLLPELSENAMVLRSQAEVWQIYCAQLEQRQIEMENMLQSQAVLRQTSLPNPDKSGPATSHECVNGLQTSPAVNRAQPEHSSKFS